MSEITDQEIHAAFMKSGLVHGIIPAHCFGEGYLAGAHRPITAAELEEAAVAIAVYITGNSPEQIQMKFKDSRYSFAKAEHTKKAEIAARSFGHTIEGDAE